MFYQLAYRAEKRREFETILHKTLNFAEEALSSLKPNESRRSSAIRSTLPQFGDRREKSWPTDNVVSVAPPLGPAVSGSKRSGKSFNH